MRASNVPARPGRGTWTLIEGEAGDPLLDELSRRLAAVMARGRTLKHDAVTTVAAVTDGRRRWVVKRYNTKNRWHAVRRLLCTSRAVNCWRAAALLEAAGIDIPRPVAVMEERRLGALRGRSCFIHEHLDGETLDTLLPGAADRATLVTRAAGIVNNLRASGIVHGDLKATNFLASGDRLYLLDLDATHRAHGRRLQAGLAKDRARFLRNWTYHPDLLDEFRRHLDTDPPHSASRQDRRERRES